MPVKSIDQINVIYKNTFCGILSKNKVNYTFKYDKSYVDAKSPIVSVNFPLQYDRFESTVGSLHPFFDNLASEGWLRRHQADALQIIEEDKFNILTHFGFDMAGAVYFDTVDIGEKFPITIESSLKDLNRTASIESRASISGINHHNFLGAIDFNFMT